MDRYFSGEFTLEIGHILFYLITIIVAPELRGPALVCLGAMDKKAVYINIF